MNNKTVKLFSRDFDYEEDDYNRLKNLNKSNDNAKAFTTKGTMKSFDFDYEEDSYEPEKNR